MNDTLYHFIKKKCMLMVLFPLRLLRVKKNRIMLHNDLAAKFSDNSKYIAKYLVEHYAGDFDIVMTIDNSSENDFFKRNNIKTCKFNSLQYFYYIMSCNVFVTNSGGFSYIPMRKSQYVINTWHGGGAYKKMGIDMYEDTPMFRIDLKLAADKTDVVLSTNKRFSQVFSESMLISQTKMWEIGMPRNDFLLKGNEILRQSIRKKLQLSNSDRLVLFAPTYRKPNDNYFKDSIAIQYGLDYEKISRALATRFGGNWKFAIRLHPLVTNKKEVNNKNILDLSPYEDMQELLLAADVMINDFSSSIWDFMLTGKPCFIFAKDMKHYIETTEVYTPVKDWPFPMATSNEELVSSILNFDEADYKEKCKRHYSLLGGCESGKATELVCQRIYDVCNL